MAREYYVRKTLEEKVGAELAAYTTSMLDLENKNSYDKLENHHG